MCYAARAESCPLSGAGAIGAARAHARYGDDVDIWRRVVEGAVGAVLEAEVAGILEGLLDQFSNHLGRLTAAALGKHALVTRAQRLQVAVTHTDSQV